jgi:tRNA nucleotidyltransferase (CCA-adding enzyme)
LRIIADYIEPALSPQLQELLAVALDSLKTEEFQGYTISSVLLKTDDYVPGLSSLASRLIEFTESNALLLANWYPVGEGAGVKTPAGSSPEVRLTVIGRSQIDGTNLNELFKPLGGGGHPKAASLILRGSNPQETLNQLLAQLKAQIPHPPTAQELMSSPVRTIRPETTIDEAQRILLRYGHAGLSVVDAQGQLLGIISRRDIDIALHHGFSHAPVKGYMTSNLKTITPDTLLPEIESLMVTYDIGRLPVLEEGQLVGIVTRTDVLRQLHQLKSPEQQTNPPSVIRKSIQEQLRDRLAPQLWEVLTTAAQQAEQRGWQLYLVGGAVRDLLLADPEDSLLLDDIDLVVDGFHRSVIEGAGMELARALQEIYPEARLQIHGRFQTAALLWHKHPELDSLWIDIATARTEFYPYPAANPEVEASSIRQDLYRRDFTINALAVRLSAPRRGELLDFFGGLLDLRARQIRVLHANSFIEDPTRIYRAVRFAVRLGFEIEPQTEGYIHHAIDSGIYYRVQDENNRAPALQTRLKAELKYILQAPYWKLALKLLADLGALRCIHPTLELDQNLWRQIRLVDRCLRRFDSQATQAGLPQAYSHWQMLLEVLIAHLAPELRGQVATNLQLPVDSIERLQQLAQDQATVVVSLPTCQRPSQVVHLLNQYELPTLILIATKSCRSSRRQIWRYLSVWRNAKPPLDGNDLKTLGYKPGRQFKQILDDLLTATLDGLIPLDQASPQGVRDQAKAFLVKHYPLPEV